MSKINKKYIEEAAEYIFRNKESKERCFVKDMSLRIVQNKEYHYYNIGNGITTGLEGFINLLDVFKEQGTPRIFHPVYFNGEELNDKDVESFWKQFDEFREKTNKK